MLMPHASFSPSQLLQHVRTASILGLILIGAAAACGGEPVEFEELPGVYRTDRGAADDVLVLCAGFAWANRFSAPGRPPVQTSGSWELVAGADPDQHVLLRGYPSLWDELDFKDPRGPAGAGPAPLPGPGGYTAMLVERGRRGAVRLTVDVHSGRAYVRDSGAVLPAFASAACSTKPRPG